MGSRETVSDLLNRSKTAKDRAVVNNIDDSKFGLTYQSLSAGQKRGILGYLALTAEDVRNLNDYDAGKLTIESKFRIDGVLYTVTIRKTDENTLAYGLMRGRKIIVRDGKPANVANQIALLLK